MTEDYTQPVTPLDASHDSGYRDPLPLPKMATLTVTLPAPTLWKLQELAEIAYGIKASDLAVLAIGRVLFKPRGRGSQVDLSKDWNIYQLWLKQLPTIEIARRLNIDRRQVYIRLTALGLRSHYRDQTRKTLRSPSSRETYQLLKQAVKAEADAQAETDGTLEARLKGAEQKRKQRDKKREARLAEDKEQA